MFLTLLFGGVVFWEVGEGIKTGLLPNLELAGLARLAQLAAPGVLVSALPSAGVTGTCCQAYLLVWVLGLHTQVLMLG